MRIVKDLILLLFHKRIVGNGAMIRYENLRYVVYKRTKRNPFWYFFKKVGDTHNVFVAFGEYAAIEYGKKFNKETSKFIKEVKDTTVADKLSEQQTKLLRFLPEIT